MGVCLFQFYFHEGRRLCVIPPGGGVCFVFSGSILILIFSGSKSKLRAEHLFGEMEGVKSDTVT